ncbi:uncharacterized protein TrAtP1_004987 [Trichoderma atroviride]|uniref:uncharacterized protein n=1 Tax=Hypocrea atroviridis TaxID=63577 RepID=UPI00332A26B9|nr:hypothetical protein TrAtP1_004987 [Trichoderma atroviride]
MTWSAPSCFNASTLLGDAVVAMTLAPALANCRAKMLTPPVPWTRTHWPALTTWSRDPYKALQAVKAAQGSVDASRAVKVDGARTRACLLKAPYVLRVLSRIPPVLGSKVWGVRFICLVGGGDDFVAGLEARDLLADGYDCACAIESGDDVFSLPWGYSPLTRVR